MQHLARSKIITRMAMVISVLTATAMATNVLIAVAI